VNPADLLSSSSRPLPGEQHRVWTQAVRALGLDLDPYTCKASYVCGMLRQFMEAAGLQMSHSNHLGALVSAASAAELLGWCSSGATNTDHAGKRLRAGVQLLEQVGPAYRGSDQRSEADLVARLFNLRNFGAHGAAHGKQLVLDQALTMWLLRSLSRALDEFWADSGDLRRHQRFAQAAITPLYTEGKPIFVPEVQEHLAKGNMPGAALAYEETWRPRQPWEDQPPLGVVKEISMSSPAVTGTPDGYSFKLNLPGNQGRE
jgi:hypothetical protein